MRPQPVKRFPAEIDSNSTEPGSQAALALRHREYAFLLTAQVDPAQLAGAIERAARLSVEPHEVLLAEGFLTPQRYVEAVAAYVGVAPLRIGQLPLGPVDLVDGTALAPWALMSLADEMTTQGRTVVLATPDAIDSLEVRQVRGARLRTAVRGLRGLDPELSAAGPVRLWQLVALLVIVGLVVGGGFIAPLPTRTVLMVCVSLPFFAVVVFRVVVLFTLLGDIVSPFGRSRRSSIADGDLPSYSVLVPLFREVAVLPDLVDALSRIDYPPAKLECMLVLEASDRATIAAARAITLPPFMRIVVVPDCTPRTKPKALNYALQLARGELVAVYDAEDVPDPGQLRAAVQAFAAGGQRVVCVQAELAIHNASDSWITRQFALEYAALFRGLLPALARLRLPIPLGGTSNHFRRSFLDASGGWDPHNVTEDADLGIRIARRGGLVATIRSVTWEEAPSRLQPWIRQRTRWLKGWLQTYLVHMRNPARLLRELGLVSFLAFQALMGGILLSCLLHPLFYIWMGWELWTGEFLSAPASTIGHGFLVMACFNLVAGIGAAMVTAAIAASREAGQSTLPHVLLMPIYWLLISWAAWRAMLQLGFAPHLWEKTEHAPRRRPVVTASPGVRPAGEAEVSAGRRNRQPG